MDIVRLIIMYIQNEQILFPMIFIHFSIFIDVHIFIYLKL